MKLELEHLDTYGEIFSTIEIIYFSQKYRKEKYTVEVYTSQSLWMTTRNRILNDLVRTETQRELFSVCHLHVQW
jgi:hypothetical protein